ncbi:immunoglobulin-like domain-containing protein [Lysinibacillus sp. NPDC097287]|uniref:immunoglobulin-like domain-containing protein n=1 Tax=Lysinibacillus sp. NPDC097287 TaxID=3364144 RepID=UPI0038294875
MISNSSKSKTLYKSFVLTVILFLIFSTLGIQPANANPAQIPMMVSLSPTDDATNVPVDANLTLTFSEIVTKAAGNIYIYRTSDNSAVQTIDVNSSVVINSGLTVTVNLPVDLQYDEAYHVQIDAGAFVNAAQQGFLGIADSTVWNFKTIAQSLNTDLAGLALSEGTLSPAFATGTTSYNTSVGNSVTSVDVTPTVADSNATVKVNSALVVSGSASNITLNPGDTTVTITVTAQDNSTKTYTNTIHRALSNESAPTVPASIVTPEDKMTSEIIITEGASTTQYFKMSNIIGGKLYKADSATEIVNGGFITKAEGNAGLKFMPDADANGSTGFGFNVQAASDNVGAGLSSPTSVAIKVTEVNDAPIAVDDRLSDMEVNGEPRIIPLSTLLANDSLGPANESGQKWKLLSLSISTKSGGLKLKDNNIEFIPALNYQGKVVIHYRIQDNGTTNGVNDFKDAIASATFNIVGNMNKPTVTPATTDEDTQSTSGLVISPTNTGSTATNHYKISNIKNGKLYLNDGTSPITDGSFITVAQGSAGLKFTPNANLFTTPTTTFGFDIQAAPGTDGQSLSDAVLASITVNPVNDAPFLANPISNQTIIAGKSKSIDLSNTFSDVDGDTLTLTATSSPPNVASVQLDNSQQLTIQGLADGTAVIKVTASDGHGGTADITVNITVTVTDTDAVAKAKAALAIGYSTGDSATSVTQKLTLPVTGIEGTTVSWASSHLAVVKNDGTVVRPSHATGDQPVTLTATIMKGTVTETKTFSLIVKANKQTDAEAVAKAKAALEIGYSTVDSATNVTQKLTLPVTGIEGTTVSWASSNLAVVKNDGTVVRPSHATGDQPVTLTATIMKGTVTETKTFSLIVKANKQTDAEAVAKAKAALEIGYSTGDSATNVTQKLTLPVTGIEGTTVSWASSNLAVVKNDGTVVRPSHATGDQPVTLTATITKGTVTETKTFSLIVKANKQTDAEAVAKAKAALEIGYSTGDSATSVTQKLTLPVTGIEGTTLRWTSSHPAVVTTGGVVQRPSVGDSTVILTATIVKGSVTETKQFTVIVKGYNDSYPPVTSTPDSSSSDSTPVPPSNTQQIVVDVENGSGGVVSKAIIKRTKNANGTFNDVVTLTEQSAREAVAKLKEQGLVTARIILPDQQDNVNEIYVSIPKSIVSILKNGGVNLEIVTSNVRILIPTRSFETFNDDLYFRVIPMKAQKEQSEVEERARKEAMALDGVDSTMINVLGRPLKIETNMQNRPVEMTLTLPTDATQEQLNHLAIFIEHSDGTKEIVSGKVVTLADGKLGIQFTVQKFSTFSVLYAPKKVVVEEVPVEIVPTPIVDVQLPYIQGYTDGTFRPNAHITRTQMATMLARNLSDNDVPVSSKASYTDTTASWAKDEIEYVRAQGIMTGREDGKFGPNESITRAQMAAIAIRWIDKQCVADDTATYCTAGTTKITFNDVDRQHWAASYIEKISALGIMTGMNSSIFNPDEQLTRAQAVKVLNRLFERELTTESIEQFFLDVPSDHWAFGEIQAAATK